LSLQESSTSSLQFHNAFIKNGSKKNIINDSLSLLAPIKDIPHIPFQRDGSSFDEEEADANEVINNFNYNLKIYN
jgi:hypothetical protein